MRWTKYFLVSVAVLSFAGVANADTLRVDIDRTVTTGDGSSWALAYKYLQDALDDATSGDQIWVAEGTYYPDRGDSQTVGDRTATFEMIAGVSIYGGFDATELLLNARSGDLDDAVTILSGDLTGSNSHHIVTADDSSIGASTVLERFTIEDGMADMNGYRNGAGMLIDEAGPTVRYCTFEGNEASNSGGAIYCDADSDVVIVECEFNWNRADYGGGIYFATGSAGDIDECTFTECAADVNGGAIYVSHSSPEIRQSVFQGNYSESHGGALYLLDNSEAGLSVPAVTDCSFLGNAASGPAVNLGGAVNIQGTGGTGTGAFAPEFTNCLFTGGYAGSGGALHGALCSPVLTNCTIVGNLVMGGTEGAGVFISQPGSELTATNCIFWANENGFGSTGAAQQIYLGGSVTNTVTYSCVQDDDPDDQSIFSGTGNIDDDPLFVDADDDLNLDDCSPCVDAGNNIVVSSVPTDLAGNTRKVNDTGVTDTGYGLAPVVDMGALEKQTDSSGC